MSRHTRDPPEQKYAAQMQVTTIKVFAAAAHCSTIHIQHLHYNITRDHSPSFKFRMEGNTEPRSGAKIFAWVFCSFFQVKISVNTTRGKISRKKTSSPIYFKPPNKEYNKYIA